MAWPNSPLQVRVDLGINGVWTNVTSSVYVAEQIVITRGRTDEASTAQASGCNLTLNNRTANFTPKNPAGIYYPYLGRNTPIRVGIGVPPQGTATGSQSGTSIVAPSVVAESAGYVFSIWAQQSNTATLTGPAGYTDTATQAGASVAGLSSITGYEAVAGAGIVPAATTTSSSSATSAAASIFIPGATAVASVAQANGQFNFGGNNGYGPGANAGSVTVAAGDVLVALAAWGNDPRGAMTGSPTDTSQSAEWTLVADSTGPTSGCRVQAWARYCPVADTFIVAIPGECYGGNDTQLTVYRVTGATSWNPRFTGACSELATTADASGNDVRCNIQAGSLLRQRGQGQQQTESVYYRYLTDKTPLAYWPLETGNLGGVFASPIAGVQNAIPFAVTSGADSTSFPFSNSMPQVAANGSIQMIPPPFAAATNQAGCLFFLTTVTSVSANSPFTLFAVKMKNDGTTATLSSFAIQYVSSSFRFVRVDGTGATLTPGAITLPTGATAFTPLGFFVSWNPNPTNPGTQVDYNVTLVTAAGISATSNFTANIGTTGQVTSLGAALDQLLAVTPGVPVTFGHVMYDPFAYNAASSTTTIAQSRVFPNVNCAQLVPAFNGEPVTLRLRRLCQDESIFFSTALLPNDSSDFVSTRHGPQVVDNILNLLTLTQNTDGGELSEPRGFNGILYRQLGSLTTRPVVQQIDYQGKMIAPPFAPAEDDQLTRNDVTITQQSGSAARATLAVGPMSTNEPPFGIGTYTSSITVDVNQQSRDLQQIADWLLSLGTYDAERFKAVLSRLESVPTSQVGLSLIDIGNHIQIINTPAWVQPGPSDVIILGLKEVIGTIPEWEITYNGRPYGPFNVFRVGAVGATVPETRVDSSSSTVTTGISSSATSMSVTTALVYDLWGTSNPPFDILVAGERMTVTAITGTSSPQTFTVTRSVNGVVKAQAAGAAVHVYFPAFLALNGGS